MKFDGIEFKACPCGAVPLVMEQKTCAGATVVTVACPACGLSNSTMYGGGRGPGYADALAMVADSWNSR